MQDLFGWQSLVPGILILGFTAGTYATLGGLRAVVLTDFIQCMVLVAGGLLLLFIGLHHIGGWSSFIQSMESLGSKSGSNMLSMVQPIDHKQVPWTGVILGLSMHALYFCSMNHDMVQRAMGAKSIHEARMGGLMAGVLKVLAVFIIVVPGLIGYVLITKGVLGESLDSPDQIFPTMVRNLLPTGLIGLTLAGLIAALMSSIDSHICAASSLLTLDWYKVYRPEADQKSLVRFGRIVGAGVILTGFMFAIFVIPNFKFLFDYLAKFVSYAAGTVVAVFLWGLLTPWPKKRAAFITLFAGSFFGLFLWLVNDNQTLSTAVCSDQGMGLAFLRMHFLHASFLIFAVSSILLFVLSYFTGTPDENGYAAVRNHESAEAMPTPKENRIFWIFCTVLVLMFAAVYLYF
jgi:SSS family solute:Na+ symporter